MPLEGKDFNWAHNILESSYEPFRKTDIQKCVNSMENCLEYEVREVMEKF